MAEFVDTDVDINPLEFGGEVDATSVIRGKISCVVYKEMRYGQYCQRIIGWL
jgi:hypothetical protein